MQRTNGAMIERKTGIFRSLRRFMCDRGGLAAVEFALILPLMIAIYFGAIEITNMLVASRRVTSVGYTAADLAAQAASISNADMTDIFAASSAILQPFSTTPLQIRITSVVANASNIPKVAWSDGYQTSPLAVGSNITLPAGLTTAGSSVIVAEVSYAYSSPISQMVTETITFDEVAYLKPRRAVQITRTN